MPQSEMEALIQLQRETIESLRQLADSQRLTIGQMDLFNEAEATMDPSVPEPTLEEAVSGYKRKAKKPKATREDILAGLPVVEVPCTVPEEDRNCPYCNAPTRVSVHSCLRDVSEICEQHPALPPGGGLETAGHLLERDMIHADETPCQVLKEEGKTAQSKSCMWLYGSGNDGLPPIRLYDYQPSRGGYHAEEFLKGFSGYLTCDGFGGYNKLKDVIRCGCLAHMRRYWHEALPGKSKKSPDKTPAEIGFDYCNQLFEQEKEYADLDANTRKARRLETEPAAWEAYWSWLESVTPAGGSRLDKAVTYAKNQKPYMENCLLDGRCSISNNIAENIARPYAVGRKNFLLHDTVKGARASFIIYSLVETAKLNNLNIYAYLETVLLYMPDYKNEPEGIEELMPWSDMIQQRCQIKSKS